MKILFLARSLGRGGAERQLSQLARVLAEAGDEVRVAVFYAGGTFEEDLVAAQIPVIDLEKKGVADALSVVYRLIRATRHFEPDVLYSFLLGPNILAVAAKPFLRNTKVVWGIRNCATDWRVYGRIAVIAARVERYLSRFASFVICNSEAGRREVLENGFPVQRTIFIANGIDTDVFRPDPEARHRMRAKWGLRDADVAIGVVGRLDPHKGHRLFFDAAPEVCRNIPQAVFICVGDGPARYAQELKDCAAKQMAGGRVIWAGAQSDMVGTYNALDVVALTSLGGDGFPNVLAEAMACGTPCVATAAGDAAAILDNPLWIVKGNDPGGLAAAIIAVAKLPRGSVGEKLRRRIVEDFSLDRARQATRTALEERRE